MQRHHAEDDRAYEYVVGEAGHADHDDAVAHDAKDQDAEHRADDGSAANPNSGTGYELEVIAMVVIGGTALMGGRGTIIGTVLGILILRVMRNGIVMVGVPGLAYNIFIGAIILGMMALHSWLERRHRAGT